MQSARANRNLWTVFILAVSLVWLPACKRQAGAITDPAGDVINQDAPDLVSATVTVAGGYVTLTATFAPDTYDPQLTAVVFFLDMDQDPATGSPGINEAQDDAALLGVDYKIYMGSRYYGDYAAIMRYDDIVNVFSLYKLVPGVTRTGDGLEITFALARLGRDDGKLNFKAACLTQVGESGFTDLQDVITDVGLPVGSTGQ